MPQKINYTSTAASTNTTPDFGYQLLKWKADAPSTDPTVTRNIAIEVPQLTPGGIGHQAGLAPDPGITFGSTRFLREDATWDLITETSISLSDVTTDNVSTTKHGFAPKLPNDATKYLDGTGNYSVPSSSGGAGSSTPWRQSLTYREWVQNPTGQSTVGFDISTASTSNQAASSTVRLPSLKLISTGSTVFGQWFTGYNYRFTNLLYFEVLVQLNGSSTLALASGCENGDVGASSSVWTLSSNKSIFFIIDEAVYGAGVIKGVTSDGTTANVIDLATTFTNGNWYQLGFQVNSNGTAVDFYINGVKKGTSTANIPLMDASLSMRYRTTIVVRSGTEVDCYVARAYSEQS